MEIDIKLLDKCPVLSGYEKDLIKRIGVNHETQVSVAKSYGKTSSTISIQHRKALAKLNEWVEERSKQETAQDEEDFDKRVFKLFNKGWSPNKVVEELGNVERVTQLWKRYRGFLEDDYCMALKKITDYGFEPSKSSKFPLSEQVQRIINERYWLAEEKKRVWKIIREKKYGIYTLGTREYDYGSTPNAVKSVLDHLEKRIRC